MVSPKLSCHLGEALRASSSTSTKEMSQSYPSKPRSAGKKTALKMYNQERCSPSFSPGASRVFHPRMLPPIRTVCPCQFPPLKPAAYPPSLQSQPTTVWAGLEELVEITGPQHIRTEGTLATIQSRGHCGPHGRDPMSTQCAGHCLRFSACCFT